MKEDQEMEKERGGWRIEKVVREWESRNKGCERRDK